MGPQPPKVPSPKPGGVCNEWDTNNNNNNNNNNKNCLVCCETTIEMKSNKHFNCLSVINCTIINFYQTNEPLQEY